MLKFKLTALITGIACTLASIHIPIVSAETKPTETVHNIVVFAQFKDTDSYNFMEDRVQEIQDMCEDRSTVISLAGYIDKISYGQMNVESHYPQLKDGTIIPYVMQMPESSYQNSQQAAAEVLTNIEIPSDIPLDGNNDGYLDNTVIVFDASKEGSNGVFWPCAFKQSEIPINGIHAGAVNVQNTNSLFENKIFGNVGALCHEFMHSIGYPDLYREAGSEGNPVGQWDIMANDSIYLQYPLAYMRAAISGWLTVSNITKSGDYALAPASSDSGNRVYILKTDLSDTEFFAVEYRQQSAKYSDELDEKIYGSGLVVYRINPEYIGNRSTEKDQVYVFRPDETGVRDGAGDIFSSNYGGEGKKTEVGSLDLSDGITDGALVYSDGTNSGIKLSDITINGDELTFHAEFASLDDFTLWHNAADTSSVSSVLSADIALGENGDPYILSGSFSNDLKLHKVENGTLNLVSNISSTLGGEFYNARLVTSGGVPYVLYNDADFRYNLIKYDTSTKNWSKIASGSSLAQYTDMTEYGGKLYLAYTVGNYPYEVRVAILDTKTNEITELGSICSNGCNISISADKNGIYAAYRDLDDGSKPKLAVWNGTAWDNVTISESSCSTVRTVADGNGVSIAATGDAEGLYSYSDGKLTFSAFPKTNGNCFDAVPFTAGDKLLAGVNTQNPFELAVYTYDSGNWAKLGNSISLELANSTDFAYSNGTVYAVYISTSGALAVKSYRLGSEEKLLGDVNNDGIVSIADAVMMQKYLLRQGELTAYKNGDISQDSTINALDMSMLRRLLINS